MRARTVRTSIALASVAGLLAACGTSSGGAGASHSASPAAELSSAVHALGHAHSLALTFSLGVSGADLLQLASGFGGDGPTKAQADALSNDHIGIEFQAADGKTLGETGGLSPGGSAFALTLGDDNQNYFTFEEVAGALYAHIDLRYFLGLANGAPSFRKVERMVSGAPAFVRDALAGKWISLPAATLKSFEGLATGQLGATPAPSQFNALRAKLLSTLLADLSVTRAASGGTDDLGITFQLRKLISDEYAAVAPTLSGLIPGGAALPPLHPAKIPAVSVHLDAFVQNSALSRVELDAGQFDTEEHISLPLELNITQQAPTITAPGNATPIDLGSIGQLLSAA